MGSASPSKFPDYMRDPNVVLSDKVDWTGGSAPSYSAVNELYEKERTTSHPVGSLEELVSNLAKNFEREVSHKKNFKDCRTLDPTNFKFSTNGKTLTADELVKMGTYNALIGECEHYSAGRVPSSEDSHQVFRSALKSGFAWEVIQVYSGPPVVTFKWRHWGEVDGELKCPMRNGKDLLVTPKGRRIEVFGMSVAHLDDKFRLTELETFWNPDGLFQQIVV